jgi:hypothetical protein
LSSRLHDTTEYSKGKNFISPWIFLSFLFLFTSSLQACPSCFSSDGSNREAYFWTAIAMTVVPLSLIAGLIWTLRKYLQQEQESPFTHQDEFSSPSESPKEKEVDNISSTP